MPFGGIEIVLVLALLLILFGAKRLPDLTKRLGQGLYEFRKAVDDESTEAGRSLGGIFGKPAAQVLTPENQVGELYDPAAFDENAPRRNRANSLLRMLVKWRRQICRLVNLLKRAP